MKRARNSNRCLGTIPCGLGIVLLATLGCGGSGDRPELGQVQGQVTLDGQPLPKCSVHFDPQGARASTGFTDEAGRYRLRYIRDIRGAVLGEHQVRILDTTGEQRIPAAYSKEGVLTKSVQPGDNEIDFELSSQP